MKNASQLREIAEMNNCLIERTITDIGKKIEVQAQNGQFYYNYGFNQYQLFDENLINDLIKNLENDYGFKVRIIIFTSIIFELEISW